MEPKKNRASNYTLREKETLFAIIAKYKNIIENKRTNGPAVAEKTTTWKKIENEFNFNCPEYTYRNWESLKKMYENQKKDLRKKVAEIKKESYKTGGGPPPKKMKENDEVLLNIISKDTVFGLENPFDCDTSRSECSISIYPSENIHEEEIAYPLESVSQRNNLEDGIEMFNVEEENDDGILKDISLSQIDNFQANHLKRPITENLKQKPQEACKNNIEIIFDNVSLNKNSTSQKSLSESTPKALVTTPVPKYKGSARRRPQTTIQTSSTLHDKYDILVDKKIANEEFLARDYQLRLEGFKRKNAMKLELLQYDIDLKKKQLEILQNRLDGK